MRATLHTVAFLLLFSQLLQAQTGCPGCIVNLPAGLPTDTIFLPAFPDGQQGQPYDQNYSFRMPVTTTPVAAIDSTTPSGLPISKIEILGLSGLPDGLDWTPNQWVFTPAAQPDGCIRICGTPTEADSFVLMVKIKVTVFFLTQEAEFPLRLYIAPEVSNTVGFSMQDFTGCGSATTIFVNNIPSNGHPGISYTWDFGDGQTFEGEHPPAHVYNQPGTYIVKYKATIDTVGYILKSVKVLEVECVDQLGLGAPDLYLLIKAPQGVQIFDSSPDVPNASLPHVFQVNLPLFDGNYQLAVWDEDSGLKGGDDLCGQISFNYLSNDTLVSGGFSAVLEIIHPVTEIISQDTVTIFAAPEVPVLATPNGTEKCAGNTTPLLLTTAQQDGLQWLLDGQPVPNATDSSFVATLSGSYAAAVTTADGCYAVSAPVQVDIYPLPASPVYNNNKNLLTILDTTALANPLQLQWYNGNTAIPGETGFKYCAVQDGIYGVLVTNPLTGCTSFYAATVDYDPAFDCTVSAFSPEAGLLQLRPNPACGPVQIQFPEPLPSDVHLQVIGLTGAVLEQQVISIGTVQWLLNTENLPAGICLLRATLPDGRQWTARLAIVR
jgi:PKD repeat protein